MCAYFPLALPVAIASYFGVIARRILRGQAARTPLVLTALYHGLTKQVGPPLAFTGAAAIIASAPSAAVQKTVLCVSLRADFGGGPEHLLQLLRHLPADIKACVACPNDYPYYERFCTLVGKDNVFVLPHRQFSPRTLWQLLQFCKRHAVAALHSHGKGAGLYTRLLALVAGTPCVHTFHGVHMGEYSPVKKQLYRLYERCMSLFTRTGIAVSQGEQQRILNKGLMPASKLRLIPNGVTLPQAVVSAVAGPPYRVVSISRFDYVKNNGFIIPLLQELRRRNRLGDFHIVAVGDGPDKESIAERAHAEGLADAITFTGATPEPHVFLQGALCYFSSSRWEGMPLAVLEAMAHGLPVVASAVVGNRDIVADGETGLLYPLDDAIAAATALCRLADSEQERNAMGRNARATVVQKYDVRHMAEQTWEILREL